MERKELRFATVFAVIAITAVLGSEARAQTVCSSRILDDVREPAEEAPQDRRIVTVNCNLTLSPSDVVTKVLRVYGEAGNGVTIDCKGAMLDAGEGKFNHGRTILEVRSKLVNDPVTGEQTWSRPQNVTIRNCKIHGSVRVYGMGPTGNDVQASSIQPGHVKRVRDSAPRNVTLDQMMLVGVGPTPLYIGPGVTYFTLSNSKVSGETQMDDPSRYKTAIYLDAESAYNIIRDNHIYTKGGRELIAIDGSERNRIYNNRFSALENGGIYLYRNCGESGSVRHTTPSHNQIINNVFYYNMYSGMNPAVYLGSRDGNRNYCDDDKDHPFGSGADNRDFAQYNVVMQNQIYKRNIRDMIRSDFPVNNPNYVNYNETVTEESTRLAGCYVSSGYETDFLRHGQSLQHLRDADDRPACFGAELMCTDGSLGVASIDFCSATAIPFSCQVTENNDGCERQVACPTGRTITGIAAACNLEHGMVSTAQLGGVPMNHLYVVRPSDIESHGSCWVESHRVSSGSRFVSGIGGRQSVTVGCSEHDSNGGDCHVRGTLYCR